MLAVDDLSRRGSELNVARLEVGGVRFLHGDVRDGEFMRTLPAADAVVVAAAETSVLAGVYDSPETVVSTNVAGAVNAFEVARRGGGLVALVSSSRVYPAGRIGEIELVETPTRFQIAERQAIAGVSPQGISERFPMDGARTIYGATKLAAELLLAEYAETHGVTAIIDRFGVLAGPWQMGHAAQGVFTYWMLAHVFGWPLTYVGYGGAGKQVRDLLYVNDAADLIARQLDAPERWKGGVFNVGGGSAVSLSLRETTALCAEIVGRTVPVAAEPRDRPGDIPIYLADMTALSEVTAWRPALGAAEILERIHRWVVDHEFELRSVLA